MDLWRYCKKCCGLFFAGDSDRLCPHTDSDAWELHDPSGSGNYDVLTPAASVPAQTGWKRCTTCNVLYYGPDGAGGRCAGGLHQPAPGELFVVCSQELGLGGYALHGQQAEWRWCSKCSSLFYAGGPLTMENGVRGAGACQAGGIHILEGSWNYILATGYQTAIEAKLEQPGVRGALGEPLGVERLVPERDRADSYPRRYQLFQRGSIQAYLNAAYMVNGAIWDLCRTIARERFSVQAIQPATTGYPQSDARPTSDGARMVQQFEKSIFFEDPRAGAIWLFGAVYVTWSRFRAELGDPRESAGRACRFERGTIRWHGDDYFSRFDGMSSYPTEALDEVSRQGACEVLLHEGIDLSAWGSGDRPGEIPSFDMPYSDSDTGSTTPGQRPGIDPGAQYSDTQGRVWRTFSAWLAQPHVMTVRHRRSGLTVQVGPAPSTPPGARVLPLRGGVPVATLTAGDAEWPMRATWDEAAGVLSLDLPFSVGGPGGAHDEALDERVRAALQAAPDAPGGAHVHMAWAHLVAATSLGSLVGEYTFCAARRERLYFSASSSVFEEEKKDWQSATLGERRIWYKATDEDGEYVYLPPSFRLGLRDDGLPFLPFLHLREGAPAEPSDDDYRVALTLLAVPVLDEGDRELLRQHIQAETGARHVRLAPASDLRATFALGSTSAGDSVRMPRPPLVDSRRGFPIELDLPASKYSLLAAQLDGAAGGVTGRIAVDLGPERQPLLDVGLTLRDLVAAVVDVVPDPGGAPGRFLLRNRCTRPVRITRLSIFLVQRTGFGLVASRGVLDATLPLTIEPNRDSAPMAVRSATGDSAWSHLDIHLDGVQVADASLRTVQDWMNAVNQAHVTGSAMFPLSIEVVNYRSIQQRPAPGLVGIELRLLPDGTQAGAQQKLLKIQTDAGGTWVTQIPRTLAQLADTTGASVRCALEIRSVYEDYEGLPQRVSGPAGTSGVLLVRALRQEDLAGRYNLLSEDGQLLQGNLDRQSALQAMTAMRGPEGRFRLEVVAPPAPPA